MGRQSDLTLESVAGIIAVDGDFYSSVSRDIVDHPDYRGMTFHFKPGLLAQGEQVKRICELLKLDASKLHRIFYKTNRLPNPDMGHAAVIAKVDELLGGQPLALVGNYFEGVAVEDCLTRVEREFKRLSL